MKKIASAIILVFPLVAQADLIRYDFKGTTSYSDFVLTGSLWFEGAESTIKSGGELREFLTHWKFEWYDSDDHYSLDNSNAAASGPRFTNVFVDEGGAVSSFFLCITADNGNCKGVGFPGLLAWSFPDTGHYFWEASLAPNGVAFAYGRQISVSGPVKVPEPSTLGLVVVTSLAFAIRRRFAK